MRLNTEYAGMGDKSEPGEREAAERREDDAIGNIMNNKI